SVAARRRRAVSATSTRTVTSSATSAATMSITHHSWAIDSASGPRVSSTLRIVCLRARLLDRLGDVPHESFDLGSVKLVLERWHRAAATTDLRADGFGIHRHRRALQRRGDELALPFEAVTALALALEQRGGIHLLGISGAGDRSGRVAFGLL